MSLSIVVMFVGGLVALVLGAGWLVRGAAKLALSFGISPLVVGLTVVAFGTSAPELAVSAGAVLDGKVDIAIGNVVGSNILNVLFILGASALIAPLVVHLQLIRQEVPIMIAATVALLLMMLDGVLATWEAAVLLGAMVIYTVFLVWQSRRQGASADTEFEDEVDLSSTWDRHWAVQVGLIVAGLAALVGGSHFLVEAAVTTAKQLGVSDVVIALTIVALGTSLPEVATSITAALKGQRDMAVGNVVGSNTFNILGCLGVSGILSSSGLAVAESVIHFDAWVMLAVALACLPIFITGREIARWEGVVFLLYYAAYTAYLILASQAHDVLPQFSAVMLYFVVPLTVITMAVSLFQHRRAGRAS
ncbi:MAG: calcium/sodium antiporter [Aquabacterium sp.]|jgi:cation:H+ antiporter|uniref:calcium/sodium antiporter n=1 Tax=Aquabacterium sp. TaxID=1872578 RepID=UPI002A36528F|nr:calcium/sodium antiporter [Aquabacterium sp.]MDX9842282.1 calcium/sodium antiporter [Aquabacterium sp.]